jgi:23S rRNA (uracil1939-C5)-methyltransferase
MSEITLHLEHLAYGGNAVGHHQGRAVFVPLGIPGETVRVEVLGERQGQLHGRLLEVLAPAPERVEPPCPYFGDCGGCHWQHIDYAAQLRFKGEILAYQFARLGQDGMGLLRPVLGMAEPWAYRNHVQLAVDAAGRLGYQALRSHDVVPVERCLVTAPLLDELWEALDLEAAGLWRVSLRAGLHTGEQMIILEGDDEAIPALTTELPVSCLYQCADGEVIVMAGNSFFHERLGGRLYRISGPSFFQVNTLQAERLLQCVLAYLAPEPQETLLDAYCGVGTFALALAPHVAEVVGIEASPWALQDAQANAADCANVTFHQGAVERVLPRLKRRFDAVILDPPRAGCAPVVLQAVAACEPRRIVYVSCDPATLARDIVRLAELGFRMAEIQPIDLFPQTFHLECVALLRREGRAH